MTADKRRRARVERNLRELSELTEQHPEWSEHFAAHNTLHPAERAAIEAQVERDHKEDGRLADRRAARRAKKFADGLEQRLQEQSERMDRAFAVARAAEPLLVERDQVRADIREIDRRIRRWAAANAHVVLARVAEGWPPPSAMCRGVADKCSPRRRCMWCQASALRERSRALYDRSRELLHSPEVAAADARYSAALSKIRDEEIERSRIERSRTEAK